MNLTPGKVSQFTKLHELLLPPILQFYSLFVTSRIQKGGFMPYSLTSQHLNMNVYSSLLHIAELECIFGYPLSTIQLYFTSSPSDNASVTTETYQSASSPSKIADFTMLQRILDQTYTPYKHLSTTMER